jgi:hypothetical protein
MDHRSRPLLRIRSFAPFVAMAALSIGCAALPKTGVEANGQPLLADVKTEDIQYVAKVKSGEVVHKDAAGNVVGTSEAYEDKLMSATITTWATFQGEDKIDDEDFFRISGDTQAADQIHAGRERAVTVNRVGFGILGAGVVLAVVGGVIYGTVKVKDAVQYDPNNVTYHKSGVGYGLLYGGIITALIGTGLVFYGNAAAHREHPLDDPRRAKRDEHKYNKEHGLVPGSSDAQPAAEAAPKPADDPPPAEEPKPKKKKKKKKPVEDDE